MYIFVSIFALIIVFLAVLCIRALTFNPPKKDANTPSAVFVNAERATSDLAEMIKCRTVSDIDKSKEDEAEFVKFNNLLPTLFPKVYEVCEKIEINSRAILLRWSGRSSASPTVLMSHYDVVSVVEENWEKPAFSGIVENGVLWGRGTLDTKGTLSGILEAAESLISDGFVPENDIYFAFGGNEEINGDGAPSIVSYFSEKGIKPGLVVDEGGAVVENVFPGVKSPCALIGIAEKGMVNLEYSVTGGGGHSSAPKPNTPIDRLAKAAVIVQNNPFKFRLTNATLRMFDTLGRHSSFVYKLIFANLWCFKPILNLITKKSGGELNAIVRTTVAFTQMEGSKGMNVIPPSARMVSNIRLLPGDTKASAIEYIKKTISDDKIVIREINGMDPSAISETDCTAYDILKSAVSETWPEAIVSPYLMVAASDSRHWGQISDKVYRFSAMALSSEERATIHGNNERIPVGTIVKTVEFYLRLIKKC